MLGRNRLIYITLGTSHVKIIQMYQISVCVSTLIDDDMREREQPNAASVSVDVDRVYAWVPIKSLNIGTDGKFDGLVLPTDADPRQNR